MSNWSELEVNLIIQIYFEMLRKELSNRKYSKTEYRKNLLPLLNNRSEGAIEFKHQNISAALIKFNQPYIKGYLPRFNYQQILDEKVAAYLENHSEYEKLFENYADRDVEKKLIDNFDKMLVKPPAIEEVNEPETLYTRTPIKINYLEREQKNSKLGYLGEKLIYNYEKWNLEKMGKEKLAQQIKWVSKEEGDGAGYDILSKTIDGQDKYIEVKTTKLGIKTPFFFSDNEFRFSNRNSKNYYLYRVFDFENRSRIFTKNGGLQEICRYAPVAYKGFF